MQQFKDHHIKDHHSFYIPVMGTGFTVDTPLFVAKYGISSVISLVDDVLIEQMRKYWSEQYGESYEPIGQSEEDKRAKRITAYLNLLNKLINMQIEEIRSAPFGVGSEINKYFEMLPSDSDLKKTYENMLNEKDSGKKSALQEQLRRSVVAGSIDVNIMTKLDKENVRKGEQLPYKFNDAAAALRGYANSDLSSTIILSAGFNPHLYAYLTEFDDFYPDENFNIRKKVCLKVSDYRSAGIQGKYLAKRGIWVSEYRVESSLNCGGHAFINDGQLLGSILEEFKNKKSDLVKQLDGFYKKALSSLNRFNDDVPQNIKITAQGGVGTYAEHKLLIEYYELDSVGWGSSFLLVPEATNVDDETLERLIKAKEDDLFISASSPMGVTFWNLKNSISEERRLEFIEKGTPGSLCPKGYIRIDKEFSETALCKASRRYQKLKLEQLENGDLKGEELERAKEEVVLKSCICHDLAGSATVRREIDLKAVPAVCPGPNIINFKKIVGLKEMISHIYGRCSLLVSEARPHIFIRELQLQLDYLVNEVKNPMVGLPVRTEKKLAEVRKNLLQGIDYYRSIAKDLLQEQQEKFLCSLQDLADELNQIVLVTD